MKEFDSCFHYRLEECLVQISIHQAIICGDPHLNDLHAAALSRKRNSRLHPRFCVQIQDLNNYLSTCQAECMFDLDRHSL